MLHSREIGRLCGGAREPLHDALRGPDQENGIWHRHEIGRGIPEDHDIMEPGSFRIAAGHA